MDITVKPFLYSGDFTLFTAVIEKETTGNATTNGETQFHHVMMKMIPDARGTALNLTDNIPVRVNLTGDLSNTKIEDYADLAVVVFVQNNKDNEVVQSAYSSEVTTAVHDIFPENDPE